MVRIAGWKKARDTKVGSVTHLAWINRNRNSSIVELIGDFNPKQGVDVYVVNTVKISPTGNRETIGRFKGTNKKKAIDFAIKLMRDNPGGI